MTTFNQIEALRADQPELSLKQACMLVGLTFIQCNKCKGAGYTKSTLLVSQNMFLAMMKASKQNPALEREPIPIQYDKCPSCEGSGGFVKE